MIIPVRCFTCNKVLANKWFAYENEVLQMLDDDDKETIATAASSSTSKKIIPDHTSFDKHVRGQILDKLGLTKICCRRHMLGHVDFNN